MSRSNELTEAKSADSDMDDERESRANEGVKLKRYILTPDEIKKVDEIVDAYEKIDTRLYLLLEYGIVLKC